jgi:DNA polymerase I
MENFIYIKSTELLRQELIRLKSVNVIGLDTETTGLNPLNSRIRLVQIAARDSPILIVDLFKLPPDGKQLIKTFLERDVIKVVHNAKFDYKFLKCEDIDISNNIYDTMLAAQLIDAGTKAIKFNLKDVLFHYTGIELNKEQQLSDWNSPNLTEEQLYYSALDASVLLPLREALNKNLKQYHLTQVALIEFAAIGAVAQMELNGIYINMEKLKSLQEEYELIKIKLDAELRSYFPNSDFNINSPVQLKKELASIGITVNSTNKETLIPLQNKFAPIELLLKYKGTNKLIQFINKIITEIAEDNRLYSNYFQCGTKTGRFSCTSFNLQQIPKESKIRECFTVADENVLIISDYSQVELRIAGEVANDATIIRAYQNDQDLHTLTASLVNTKPFSSITKKERDAAKALNFGLLYGMGSIKFKEYALNKHGVDMSLDEAGNFRAKFFQHYSGLKKWHQSNTQKINNSRGGEYIEARTLTNRSRKWIGEPSFAEYINFPVQGTGADILKIALGTLPTALIGTSAKIIATVHDEILLEANIKDAESVKIILKNVMEVAGNKLIKKIQIIADAKIATNWSEK